MDVTIDRIRRVLVRPGDRTMPLAQREGAIITTVPRLNRKAGGAITKALASMDGGTREALTTLVAVMGT